MTSAAGVRYGVGKLRLSRFQKCAVRRLPSRKSSSILQLKTNVQYSRKAGAIIALFQSELRITNYELRNLLERSGLSRALLQFCTTLAHTVPPSS